jgi:hypothetical protein
MAMIIASFQRGDLQKVTGDGVLPLCIGGAFTPESQEEWNLKLGNKTRVVFDNTYWSKAGEPHAKAA